MSGVLFCGCGNMGSAILRSALEKGILWAKETVILEKHPNQYTRDFEAQGCRVIESLEQMKEKAQLVVFAVKPQDAIDLFLAAQPHVEPSSTLISIMAGICIETIELHFPLAAVIRAMPNTPAAIGQGMTAYVGNAQAGEIQLDLAMRLFDSLGKSLQLEKESMIDAVTAVSGSGPAYLFYLAEAMHRAAMDLDFTADEASLLVNQTLVGASALLQQSGEAPGILREKVTSKGGTTAAALQMFDEGKVSAAIQRGMRAASSRSEELGNLFKK